MALSACRTSCVGCCTVFMMDEIRLSLEKLAEDLRRNARLRVDEAKLCAVEQISMLLGRVLALLSVVVPLLFAVLFFLLAAACALVPLLGLVWSMVAVGVLLVAVAAVLYCLRGRLFGSVGVRALCQLFFKDSGDDEKE